MKIGLLHDSLLPPKGYGGIERIVVTLAEEYLRRGHSVVVFCREGSVIPGCEIRDWKTLDLSGIDFLHSHQPLHTKPSVPFLVTIHGNGHEDEKYFSNTNFLSQSHARNHNAKYFIYNGVDQNHYPVVTKKEDYFVFLARTTWRVKNVKTAIAWANDLGVRLEIMGGSGISRGLINYNGLVDEDQKLELLSRARALIYPTNWDEPCAAAPLEALACGTPVITTANGCMPELVREGTGIVCRDYRELLEAGDKVRSIDPLKCRAAIENYFSLSRMTDDYLKMFDKILRDGELDHKPRYHFKKSSVQFLFKPTFKNRIQYSLLGKI
jgi:glycosyltransferase involved in cell wall biosynthesis